MQHLFRFLVCFLCASVALQAEDVLRPGSVGQERSSNDDNDRDGRQWHAGIEAGVTASFFSQDISGLVENSLYAPLESQSGLAPYFAAYIDIPSSIHESLSYRVKAAYDQKDFSNTEQATGECQVNLLEIVEMTVDSEFENTVSYLDLGIALHWQATENWYGLIGPVFQFGLADIEQTWTQSIIAPEDCFFDLNGNGIEDEGDSRTQSATAEDAATESFRVGLEIGGGYAFPIGDDLELTAGLLYQFMFTPPLEDTLGIDDSRPNLTGLSPAALENAALNSLILTLGLRFGL